MLCVITLFYQVQGRQPRVSGVLGQHTAHRVPLPATLVGPRDADSEFLPSTTVSECISVVLSCQACGDLLPWQIKLINRFSDSSEAGTQCLIFVLVAFLIATTK